MGKLFDFSWAGELSTDGTIGYVDRVKKNHNFISLSEYFKCGFLHLRFGPINTTNNYFPNPPENKRSYSSVLEDNAIGTGFARSMIGSNYQRW